MNGLAASFMYGFLQRLVDYTKNMLVAYERPMSLDGAIELSIQLEWQVQAIGRRRQLSPQLRMGAFGMSRRHRYCHSQQHQN